MTLPGCSKVGTSVSVANLCLSTPASLSSPTAIVTFTHLAREQTKFKHKQTPSRSKNQTSKKYFHLHTECFSEKCPTPCMNIWLMQQITSAKNNSASTTCPYSAVFLDCSHKNPKITPQISLEKAGLFVCITSNTRK